MADIPRYLEELKPLDVEWQDGQKTLWVKKFLKNQGRSPKFLEAVASALGQISNQDSVSEFLLYNHGIMADLPIANDISLTRRECVAIRDRFVCAYCGKQIDEPKDYEMDHITPVSKKGLSNYANLVTCCRECNQAKLDHLPEEVGFKRPIPSSFHAAQGLYVLKNDKVVLSRWLMVFPERKATYCDMLANVGNNQQQIGYPLDSDRDSDSDKYSDKDKDSDKDIDSDVFQKPPYCEALAIVDNNAQPEIRDNHTIPFDDVVALWNSTVQSLPRVQALTDLRKRAIKARWNSKGSMDKFSDIFQRVERSDFLTGRTGGWGNCCFDWVLKPTNWQKICEGNYDNKAQKDMTTRPPFVMPGNEPTGSMDRAALKAEEKRKGGD